MVANVHQQIIAAIVFAISVPEMMDGIADFIGEQSVEYRSIAIRELIFRAATY
ncbi:hypothetical protein MWK35_11345 [Escherichia coli]|nr:hypothetical protein [Escherichia coli]